MDPLQLYDLESYLFSTVQPRFHAQGWLSAFDFFCIVIWKANRAKSRVAARLLGRGYTDLDGAVRALTSALAQQPDARARLRLLMLDWGFLLPMASAILTVLYPDEFTVYDVRVCDALSGYHDLANKSDFEALWTGYEGLRRAVEQAAPAGLSLRDKDRWLWGRSFGQQLQQDIARAFGHHPG